MKLERMVVLLLLALVVMIACQKTPTPIATQESEQEPAASEVQEMVEAEEITYPEPGSEAEVIGAEPQSFSEVLYPMYEDNSAVMWSQAQAMIFHGEVERIIQNDSLQITLLLKDGRTLLSSEPNFDDVKKLVDACGESCKDIEIEDK